MIAVSDAFKNELANDNRRWVEFVHIVLQDGTVLDLSNDDLWGNGFTIDNAVSADSSFTALGAVIINKAKVVINNIYDKFTNYDFDYASVTLRVGLLIGQNIEAFNVGVYVVDEVRYNGSLITLDCLDHMATMDELYSKSILQYPATLGVIVQDICSVCGVTLKSQDFPNSQFQIGDRPNDEAITCREVLSWCAQIAGCFARFDTYGQLELAWFDTSTLNDANQSLYGGVFDTYSATEYITGDIFDGGHFRPWETGSVISPNKMLPDYHEIVSTYATSYAKSPVTITGVKCIVEYEDDDYTGTFIAEYS